MKRIELWIQSLLLLIAILPLMLAFQLSQTGCDDGGVPAADRQEHFINFERSDYHQSYICDQDIIAYSPMRVVINVTDANGNQYAAQEFPHFLGAPDLRVLVPENVSFRMEVEIYGSCHGCCSGILRDGGPLFHGVHEFKPFSDPDFIKPTTLVKVKFISCFPCKIG